MVARRVGGLWIDSEGRPAGIVVNPDGTNITSTAIPAGEAFVGKVGGVAATIRATLNGVSPGVIAAAGDYTANDVLSQSATADAGVHWLITNAARVTGGSGWITKVRATCSVEALAARLRIWLFDADPSGSEKDDNAAFNLVAADRAKCLGYIDLPAPSDVGAVSYTQNTTERFKFVCASGTRNLYAIVQTLDAITNESASMTLDIHFTVDQD